MEVITGKIYKCSFCGHRTLTKKGMELHEGTYCKKNKNSIALMDIEDYGESQEIRRGDYSSDELARNNAWQMGI